MVVRAQLITFAEHILENISIRCKISVLDATVWKVGKKTLLN